MTALLPRRVLVAGLSTRAAAESAARAGFVVTGIDAFGDLDQDPRVRTLSLPRDFGARFTAAAAARASRNIECDAVAYLSNFENHPRAVGTLATGRALWGNAPAVLQRVRDPMLVARAFRGRGCAAPDVHVPDAYVVSGFRRTSMQPPRGNVRLPAPSFGEGKPDTTSVNDGRWLVKPLASGGGYRVRPWPRATPLPRGCYLQERVDGTLGSVAFIAAGGRAVPLGVSRQLVGEHAFGAARYRYCGNILAAAGDAQFAYGQALMVAACALACAVAEEFGVVGVNGIDFVARDGVPYAIEVNPRWSASMELVERAYGLSVFGAHAAACATGALPAFDLVRARRRAGAVGKAVVFARRDVVVGNTRAWLPPGNNVDDVDEVGDVDHVDAAATVRDIPHPGERIAAGRAICTVFATGRDEVACHRALVQRAERVYAELAAWEREVA